MKGNFTKMKSNMQANQTGRIQQLDQIANRYLIENPVENVRYLRSITDNFHRNSNLRYELNFNNHFTYAQLGEWLTAWCRIESSEKEMFHFFVNPYSPTTIKINQKTVYRSSISAENRSNAAEYFSYTASTSELSVEIITQKTKTGWGCEFGSSQIKSKPLYVLGPTKQRETIEGFVYTKPSQTKPCLSLKLGQDERIDEFYPRLSWSHEELKEPLFKRLNADQKEYFFACCQIVIAESGSYQFHCNFSEATFYIEGQEVKNDQGHELEKGQSRLFIKLPYCSSNPNRLSILITTNHHKVDLKSIFNPDFPVFSYLGPLKEMDCDLEKIFSLKEIIENQFWRIDQPNQIVRLFQYAPLFGNWNYPLGVTLRGLLLHGIQNERSDLVNYVQAHISFCTSHYQYSLWDKVHFGAPAINQSLVLPDSLDDCGSFAKTVLEAIKYCHIEESDTVLQSIASYIMNRQGRRSNGMLYRVNAHMSLMENTAWADDTYMSLPFLIAYSAYLEDGRYLEEALKQYLLYDTHLWNEELHLFDHVYNFEWGTSTGIPWGRGNGWILLSLTELLEAIERNQDAQYSILLQRYRQFALNLYEQMGINGMWHQLLDDSDSYEETSATAIILYCLGIGLEKNWLTKEEVRLEMLEKSWAYLVKEQIDSKGNLYGVCQGSGYSFSRDYYKFDLKTRKNDTHGIGIVLMAGCQLERLSSLIES